MALTLQDGIYVWLKVAKAVANASPANQAAFRDLKNYLTTQGGNPQLQFVAYTDAQAITNNGTSLVGGACTLYAWYGVASRASGTTAAFQAIHDAADNTATTTTVVTQKINLKGQNFSTIRPSGIALATDAVISSATAVGGATESASLDATNGFIVVGA